MFGTGKFLEKLGVEHNLDETVMQKYIQQKIYGLGYQGIMGTNYSFAAKCRYFAALDPSLIEIIS